ncbi:GH1 family beta-glucosidase [Idiomarina baltica]|uniref:Beta-glucosidase n=2 Tax=Idiomarina baltica TaxID=190892 RepID=A0A348WQI4_9GAMM|nr:GH1 family beta-glucosidase [Idiomarina baltica]EAQ32459.1 beta-glucosidase [Idiomarina baltica OS145]HAR56796.1 beta-glucosidase [Idiomarina baltica]
MKKITLPYQSRLNHPSFTFGVATSSFQIEGDIAGREPCIWDSFCQQPNAIKDGSNGNVACDHIHRWQEDVELISELGVDAYRFSIAWGRVIKANGEINRSGLNFYIKLVEALAERGIQSHITLYHWDLPQYLEDQGGWLNRATAYRFADYARVIADALGHQVSSIATLNEPFCSAYLGYEAGIHAPGPQAGDASRRKQGRQAAHHLLLAHGLALQALRDSFADGKAPALGVVLNFSPCHPLTSQQADRDAAEFAHQYHNLWYLQPMLSGTYPDVIEQLAVTDRPQINAGDMAIINQPLDFLGVNYYTRTVFKANQQHGFSDVPASGDGLTTMGWEVYAKGLTEILLTLDRQYDNLPPIYITENGIATADSCNKGEVDDVMRIDYFQSHLLAVHDAINHGVDIRGYFAWSLMDNFEWAEGYTQRFGIIYVDYNTQQRTFKNSAKALQKLFLARQSQHHAVEDIC